MGYRNEIRVDGPVKPHAGNVYVVVIRDSVNPNITRTTIPASLKVCTEVCTHANVTAKKTIAHIKYVGDGMSETTEKKD